MNPFDDEANARAIDMLAAGVLVACFATLVVLALTEQFAGLPGAAAALISSWCLVRVHD